MWHPRPLRPRTLRSKRLLSIRGLATWVGAGARGPEAGARGPWVQGRGRGPEGGDRGPGAGGRGLGPGACGRGPVGWGRGWGRGPGHAGTRGSAPEPGARGCGPGIGAKAQGPFEAQWCGTVFRGVRTASREAAASTRSIRSDGGRLWLPHATHIRAMGVTIKGGRGPQRLSSAKAHGAGAWKASTVGQGTLAGTLAALYVLYRTREAP